MITHSFRIFQIIMKLLKHQLRNQRNLKICSQKLRVPSSGPSMTKFYLRQTTSYHQKHPNSTLQVVSFRHPLMQNQIPQRENQLSTTYPSTSTLSSQTTCISPNLISAANSLIAQSPKHRLVRGRVALVLWKPRVSQFTMRTTGRGRLTS